jgi:hypothetical protein
MGTAAVLRAAADAGLHVTGQWRDADRAFVLATRAAVQLEAGEVPDAVSLVRSG